MEDLDKDRLFLIAVELNLPSLLNFCASNTKIQKKICNRPDIWIYKLKSDFNYIIGVKDTQRHIEKEIYKILYEWHLNIWAVNNAIVKAIKLNSLDVVKHIYNTTTNPKYARNSLNDYLWYAVHEQNEEMIDYFISIRAKNFIEAFYESIRVGNLKLFEKFLLMTVYMETLNTGLALASRRGNVQMVNILISKGANDWETGLSEAASAGSEELVDFFISKGAHN